MSAVLVLGVLALFAAIVAWVTWHRAADERQSVQHHQHTLETLRHVADRRQQTVWPSGGRRVGTSKVRPPPRRLRVPESPPPSRRPRAPWTAARESAKVAARRQTMVFADDEPGTATARSSAMSASTPGRPGRRPGGTSEEARRRRRDRVHRTRLIVGATAVVAVVAVGAALVFGSSAGPLRPSHRSQPLTAAGHGHVPSTAPSAALTPAAPTAYSATYAVPSSSYTVVVGASAQCWVMATQGATGNVVWTGTVPAGGSQALPVAGTLVVELGAPSDASVTLDGKPVQLPAGFRSPFRLTFAAAG